jgi:hypothetical protein
MIVLIESRPRSNDRAMRSRGYPMSASSVITRWRAWLDSIRVLKVFPLGVLAIADITHWGGRLNSFEASLIRRVVSTTMHSCIMVGLSNISSVICLGIVDDSHGICMKRIYQLAIPHGISGNTLVAQTPCPPPRWRRGHRRLTGGPA